MIKRLKSKLAGDAHFKDLLRGSAITFILKIGGMLLGYVVIYLISKKNGADGVGFYSLVNQVLLLLSIVATWGTTTSALRYVGQFNNAENSGQLRFIYSALLKVVVPIGMLVGLLTFLFAYPVAHNLLRNDSYTEALQLTGIVVPFFAINSIGIEFIRGMELLQFSEFIRSVSRPLILLIALLLFLNDTIPNIYPIYFLLIAVVLNSFLSNGIILQKLSKTPRAETSRLHVRELFRVSSPMMISGLTGTLMSSIPLFFLSYFHDAEQVGIFSVALRISMLISLVLTVVNTIAAPKYASLFWSDKKVELQRVIDQSTQLMFWGAFIISLIVIAFAPYILSFFGSEFSQGSMVLIILVLGQFFNAFTGSVGLLLNMSGKQKVLRNSALISLAIQLVTALLLIPNYGMIGGAITSSVAGIVWNIMCILYVQSKLQIRTYYLPFIRYE